MRWRLDARRLREAVFLVIGLSTPIGILAVNASAFIMGHLAEFRLAIAICALASGLSLNGLGAWAALNRARRHVPDLYAEYRIWLVIALAVFVVGWSVLGAYLTYESMKDPRQLPNLYAVLTALWLLFLPVAITFVSRRLNLLGVEAAPSSKEAVSP
jgi:uncharacterized membrane protein YidH (DUF202 family)